MQAVEVVDVLVHARLGNTDSTGDRRDRQPCEADLVGDQRGLGDPRGRA